MDTTLIESGWRSEAEEGCHGQTCLAMPGFSDRFRTCPRKRGHGTPKRGHGTRAAGIAGFAQRLHRDERGVISILTVFAVLILTVLLGMVMNVGRQIDGKIRMQNAADATAYSGAVILARGMTTLAFTNHLLCDVFALTAFMREAHDRHSDKY